MEDLVVLYGTNYGTTRRYAENLASRIGVTAVNFEHADIPSGCKVIVYFGGLYAGGVKGMKETLPKIRNNPYAKLIIVTVGLADVHNEENINNIRTSLSKQLPPEIYEKAKIYHLRGGIDYKKLNFMHKSMMKMLYSKAKKIPEEQQNAEVKAMIETYGQYVDFVDFEELTAIENEIRA